MYKLWIDKSVYGLKNKIPEGFIGAATCSEAVEIVKQLGGPREIDLTFELNQGETVMKFLHWLKFNYPKIVPKYSVHNCSEEDLKDLQSFFKIWKSRK